MNSYSVKMKSKPFRIEEFALVDEVVFENYDFFDQEIPQIIKTKISSGLENNVDENIFLSVNTKSLKSIFSKKQFNNPMYIFCEILCDKDVDTTFLALSSSKFKVWVNNSLCCISDTRSHNVFSEILVKGKNIILFEFENFNFDMGISLRVSTSDFEKEDNFSSLLSGNHYISNDSISVVFNSACLDENYEVTFLSAKTSFVNASMGADLKVYYNDSFENLIYAKKVQFGKRYTVKLPKQFTSKEAKGYIFGFFCQTSNNQNILCAKYIYNYTEKNNGLLVNKINEQLSTRNSKYSTLALKYYLREMNNLDDVISPWLNHEIIQTLSHVKENNLEKKLKKPGIHKKFFSSKLDDSIDFYMVAIPNGYDPNISYPLIISFPFLRYGHECGKFMRYENEPIISADISARGVTMGSYIGEAAIWEATRDLLDTYNVDMDRIYSTGISNGAAASWAQAITHPDFFAGVFPISGAVNKNMICNLNNLRVITVSSEHESLYSQAYDDLQPHLVKNENYSGVLAKNMKHEDLLFLQVKDKYIREMLCFSKNDFPTNIEFRTTTNRNRKAYWVLIHSISYAFKTAYILVKAKDDIISLKIENCNGVTITIPPYINKDAFKVVINESQTFSFRNYIGSTISFVNDRNTHKIGKDPCSPLSRKGYGLLDVYLDPIKIITRTSDKNLLNIAKNFSSPLTNGHNSKIYVEYPIHDFKEFEDYNEEHSLIIIDNNTNEIPEKIKNEFFINMTSSGFCYKKESFIGDYCIMKIIPNPHNKNNSILYVNTNNLRYARKNIFIRRLIINSYSNGENSLLNNEALIYYENKFYAIYESGMDMVEEIF